MHMADQFPSAEVIGNDLSPIQPTWIPPNCSFEVDDFNEPFTYSKASFDLVHGRALHASVKSWPDLCANAYKVLKPGGWFETCDENIDIYAEDGTMPDDFPVKIWCEKVRRGCDLMGKTAVVQPHIEEWMQNAGFVNIKQKLYKVPIGTWPKNKEQKKIGALNLLNMLMGADGFTLAIYTRLLKISTEDTMKELDAIKKSLRNKKVHMMFQVHRTIGQKPLGP